MLQKHLHIELHVRKQMRSTIRGYLHFDLRYTYLCLQRDMSVQSITCLACAYTARPQIWHILRRHTLTGHVNCRDFLLLRVMEKSTDFAKPKYVLQVKV